MIPTRLHRGIPGAGSPRIPEFVLLLVTIVWGGTFLVSQIALRDGDPFGLLLVRFTIGALTLAFVFRRRMRGLTRAEVSAGAVIGLAAFGSFAFQTTGLQYIASSKSAFLTALYVPIVPLLQLGLLGVAPRLSAWLGITVSFTGLIVLSWGEGIGFALGFGEWLTLGGALLAALQIILISRWAPRSDPLRLATVQLVVIAGLSLLAIPLAGEPWPAPTASFATAAVALGVLGSAFAIAAMNWAQRTVSATRATIIYAMEPVWAGVFGAIAGEAMTALTITGSSLIIAGILVSEIRVDRLLAPRAAARREAEILSAAQSGRGTGD
ncbi:MAG TPA: DMT family transporter [Longimicrobiaceae bacterium]|nr:DMT family transporter [Longimicrobiaceae bacterium]